MSATLLVRIDPARRMPALVRARVNRWYAVSVQSSLFDEYVVALAWS